MKKPKYPDPGDIEQLIADYQRLAALRQTLEEKTTALRSATADARRRVVASLRIPDASQKDLAEYVSTYRKLRLAHHETDQALAAYAAADTAYDEAQSQVDGLESTLRVKALQACALAEGVKRAEYEALVSEIESVLRPYCDGDNHAASQLAMSTPAAAAKQAERDQCYTSIYGWNLTPPLRAVLSFATAKLTSK